ncbi:MAG: 2-hydroxyacyl-CoA dehydratase [Deltaproteobacteria bacterium]|nr:2-hydroxyacyl-CoA dehydratase [Deltaproteobacteria bacterium]
MPGNQPFPPGVLVGLTTTIPVEAVLAAGLVPVDLNNLFISHPEALAWVSDAEAAGFPRTICAWVKGIYAALSRRPDIRAVLVACQGDCSYTQALGELLEAEGREVVHFQFPYPPHRELLSREIAALAARLGTSIMETSRVQMQLRHLRRNLGELDRLTYETGQVTGRENFNYLIASSDFESDLEAYSRKVAAFLREARTRKPHHFRVRLGLVGIPPIFGDLWDYLEELDASVVFNEIPRQFSMPYPDVQDLADQYLRYTYPYDIFGRLTDMEEAIRVRRIDGLVHYTQSFCFRQMFDQVLRERLNIPVLTIEGDRPTPLDTRTRMRLEAFVDVLRA